MFKNKHVLAALIITPILSILGYFAVDALVSETPHKAIAGESYELVARSSCRYASGRCVMANGDFKLDIGAEYQPDGSLKLSLLSVFPLEGGKIAIVDHADNPGEPADLSRQDTTGQHWSITVPAPGSDASLMRLVVAAKDSVYYGEAPIIFSHYQTSFGEDFRGVSE